MHGWGDDSEPLDESVELMEEMVCTFIAQMTEQTMSIAASAAATTSTATAAAANRRDKLKTENLLFLIRKDRPKYSRSFPHPAHCPARPASCDCIELNSD